MSFDRPFRAIKSLAAPAAVTLALLSPVALLLPARIQAAEQADAADSSKTDGLKIAATQTTGVAGKTVAVDQSSPIQPNSAQPNSVQPNSIQPSPAQSSTLPTRAIEKAKQVAKSAGDIFSRVPCLPPKGGIQSMG